MFEAAVEEVRIDSCPLQSSSQVEPASMDQHQLFVDALKAAIQLIIPKHMEGFSSTEVVHVGLAKHSFSHGRVGRRRHSDRAPLESADSLSIRPSICLSIQPLM